MHVVYYFTIFLSVFKQSNPQSAVNLSAKTYHKGVVGEKNITRYSINHEHSSTLNFGKTQSEVIALMSVLYALAQKDTQLNCTNSQ